MHNDQLNPLDSQDQLDAVQVDGTLVAHLLKLSYEERIDAHESARALVCDLMEAGKDYYAQRSKDLT